MAKPMPKPMAKPSGATRGRLISVVTNFISAIGLLALVGYWLDQRLDHTHYIWTIVGILFAFAWGFYELIKFARAENREVEQSEGKPR